MKAYRKLTALLLTFFMLSTSVQAAFGAPKSDSDTAEAVLTRDSFSLRNFDSVEPGLKNEVAYSERDSTVAWTLDRSSGTNSSYIYFDLSNDLAFKVNDGSVFDIEFEYYSENNGYFQVVYDSQTKAEHWGELVYTGNNRRWNKSVVTIEDAYFGNRLKNKYDFMISIRAASSTVMKVSDGNVALRNVKVTRRRAYNPVTVKSTTPETGNAFRFFDEEKTAENTFTNNTDEPISAKVTYSAVGTNGITVWSEEAELTLEPREVKQQNVNIDTDRCDVYKFYVDITTDGGIHRSFEAFDFSILKTDPDGIKNHRHYMQDHIRSTLDVAEDAVDMLAKSNAWGVREDFGWNYVEPVKGTFSYNDPDKTVHELLHAKGLDVLVCINFSARSWMGHHDNFPTKEEEFNRFGEAVEFIVNQLPYVRRFEIWNEPTGSLVTSGRTPIDPDDFAHLTRVAIDTINKTNPSAETGITCMAGLMNDITKEYYKKIIDSEYDIWKDATAVTLHPYMTNTGSDRGDAASVVGWYRDYIKSKGRDDIEIWNTELGFSTTDPIQGTEAVRADSSVRSYLYHIGEDGGDVYVTYNFDRKGVVEIDREDMYGVTSSGHANTYDKNGKPYIATDAFVALTAMNYLMAESERDGKIVTDDPNELIYKFKSDKFNNEIITMWNMNETSEISLNLGVNQIQISDIFGNISDMYSDTGIYSFTLTGRPFYIMGDIADAAVVDTPVFEYADKEINVIGGDSFTTNIVKHSDKDYTVKVSAPPAFKVVGNPVFNGNTAEVTISVDNAETETNIVELQLYDGDKLVSKSPVTVNIAGERVTSSVTVDLPDYSRNEKWKGYMEIKNHSIVNAAKGYIKFNQPASFARLGKIDIGVIPKGKTSLIEFNCPDILRKGSYSVNYDITLESGESYNSNAMLEFTLAKKAKNPIVIDGVLDESEWDFTTALYSDNKDQIASAAGFYYDWKGKDDLSAKTVVSWDEEKFYFASKVTDDIHFNDQPVNKSYMGDSIQFATYNEAIPDDVLAGNTKAYFNEICIASTDVETGVYRFKSQMMEVPAGPITEGVEIAVKRVGNETCYELSITWDELCKYEYTPEVGGSILFSALYNENDGWGRLGFMEYSSGIGWTKNAGLFTTLKFIE